MQTIFQDVFRRNAWGDAESVSGPGSGLARTALFRDQIASLLRQLQVKTLLDAGCGDFNWMRMVDLGVEAYVGIDIVPELIAQNQTFAGSVHMFRHADIISDHLPQVDLILCRDCLVHLSLRDVRAAIDNFRRSRARYLLVTSMIDCTLNTDIATGGWRQLNLELPPFVFAPPITMIDEKSPPRGGIQADKRLCLWRLEDLALP